MSESSGKCRNRYVDNLEDIPKLTCIINAPGNLLDECKILGKFGTKYAKIRPTKDFRQEPKTNKQFLIQKQNNDIVQHVVDENILKYKEKIIVKHKTHKNIDYEFDEYELYRLDKMSPDEK